MARTSHELSIGWYIIEPNIVGHYCSLGIKLPHFYNQSLPERLVERGTVHLSTGFYYTRSLACGFLGLSKFCMNQISSTEVISNQKRMSK